MQCGSVALTGRIGCHHSVYSEHFISDRLLSFAVVTALHNKSVSIGIFIQASHHYSMIQPVLTGYPAKTWDILLVRLQMLSDMLVLRKGVMSQAERDITNDERGE